MLKLKGRGIFGTFADAYIAIRRDLYGLFLRAPGVRSQVQKQVNEAVTKLQSKLVPSGPGVIRYLNLPKEGWSEETVLKELDTLANMDHTRWEDGFVSGAVYHGGDSLMKLQTEAFGKFTVANPIHPDVFPGVRKMEAEIVSMVLAMFNAPVGAAGVTTSGGTESILMACLSARQKAYAERGVTEPEMYANHTLVPSNILIRCKDSTRYRSYCIPKGRLLLWHQSPPSRLPSSQLPGRHPSRLPSHQQ